MPVTFGLLGLLVFYFLAKKIGFSRGQAVVVVGAKEWQEMRRAMVAAGNALVGERGPVN
jgi:hypothetical protein